MEITIWMQSEDKTRREIIDEAIKAADVKKRAASLEVKKPIKADMKTWKRDKNIGRTEGDMSREFFLRDIEKKANRAEPKNDEQWKEHLIQEKAQLGRRNCKKQEYLQNWKNF